MEDSVSPVQGALTPSRGKKRGFLVSGLSTTGNHAPRPRTPHSKATQGDVVGVSDNQGPASLFVAITAVLSIGPSDGVLGTRVVEGEFVVCLVGGHQLP